MSVGRSGSRKTGYKIFERYKHRLEALTDRSRRVSCSCAKALEFKGITDRMLPTCVHPSRLSDRNLIGRIRAMNERLGRDVFHPAERAGPTGWRGGAAESHVPGADHLR